MTETLRLYVLYGFKPSPETTWGSYLRWGLQWKHLIKLTAPLSKFNPSSLNKDFLRWLHEATYESFKERTGQSYGYIRLNGFRKNKKNGPWINFGKVKLYPERAYWADKKHLLYRKFAQVEMIMLRRKLMSRGNYLPEEEYDELNPPLY